MNKFHLFSIYSSEIYVYILKQNNNNNEEDTVVTNISVRLVSKTTHLWATLSDKVSISEAGCFSQNAWSWLKKSWKCLESSKKSDEGSRRQQFHSDLCLNQHKTIELSIRQRNKNEKRMRNMLEKLMENGKTECIHQLNSDFMSFRLLDRYPSSTNISIYKQRRWQVTPAAFIYNII